MQLMDLIQSKYRIVSVVGMAKNAGKTMTLNTLIDEAMERNLCLGITSTGRDGEKQDLVTNTEKPLIYVAQGTLIATTEETFKWSEVRMEILEVTDFSTSMGRIVIAQAKNAGYVQIAGPNTNREMKEVAQKLLFYGAQLVIVDGAIDRVASASPAVTEATILATGAVLSRDMNQVIERSIHQTRLFSLPKIEDESLRKKLASMMEEKGYCMVDEAGNIKILEIKTALNSGAVIGSAMEENTRYVVIGGSLVSKTLKDIVAATQKYKQVIFVVKDATKIFIDTRDFLYFEKIGIQIQVIDKIEAVAVTVNPYAPQGYYFNPEEFRYKMEQFLNPIPVFDVVLDGGV